MTILIFERNTTQDFFPAIHYAKNDVTDAICIFLAIKYAKNDGQAHSRIVQIMSSRGNSMNPFGLQLDLSKSSVNQDAY